MGQARLSQPDLFPRGRQGRTFRGVGAAAALFRGDSGRVSLAPLIVMRSAERGLLVVATCSEDFSMKSTGKTFLLTSAFIEHALAPGLSTPYLDNVLPAAIMRRCLYSKSCDSFDNDVFQLLYDRSDCVSLSRRGLPGVRSFRN